MKICRKLAFASLVLMSAVPAFAQEEAAAASRTPLETAAIAAAAALTMALSVLGSGAAIGKIGSAALGAAAEKPELLSKSILFVALAEGLCVLGFVISIMLVTKIV